MKITIKMTFQSEGKESEQYYEGSFATKENLFSAAPRINDVTEAMLQNGLLEILEKNFVDRKNKIAERQKLSSDVSQPTVDAVAGQSPYGFRKGKAAT